VALAVLAVRHLGRFGDLPRADRVMVLGAAILAVAALSASRNVAFFAVVAAPAVSRLWAALTLTAAPSHRARPLGAVAVALCLAVAAGGAAVVAGRWRAAGAELGWQPVSNGALEALRQCPDPLFNEMRDGGFLIWALADRRVFVDGRMEAYPLDLLQASRRADLFGEYEPAFDRYRIRCALVTSGSRLHERLAADRRMTETYSDAARSVFIRSTPALATR
jgi:hypothetical protein